ncbi:glycosyltransferase family 2 protein [Phocaeicola paurosaccharolyticus]|uniref:glycosyltransferase family 2 protein n=1 Tax=Phocaeicola paurosaccharolyticus TaxID=732242 RepID=UPI002FE1660B
MTKISQDISLIITTYNNPAFLELILKSILSQRLMPLEVIIADDGSTYETRVLIDSYRKFFSVPLIHSWIPDEGFRVAKSRNKAIARAKGNYIVIIDGDIVVNKYFISDHNALKKIGYFVTGSRARLKEEATINHCQNKDERFDLFSKGLTRRLVMLRIPYAHKFIKGHSGLKNARSCHMAFWKDDFINVNGFEEDFEGWGFEDSEFVQRLYNNGLKRKNAKLMAPAVHLYHKESNTDNAINNRRILEETINSHKKKATKGILQYLDSSITNAIK